MPCSTVSVARDDASLRRTCKLCGKTLTTELGLKYHVAMHDGAVSLPSPVLWSGIFFNHQLEGSFGAEYRHQGFHVPHLPGGIHVWLYAKETHAKVSC